MDLNNRRTGKHATKPRALGLLGHSGTGKTLNGQLTSEVVTFQVENEYKLNGKKSVYKMLFVNMSNNNYYLHVNRPGFNPSSRATYTNFYPSTANFYTTMSVGRALLLNPAHSDFMVFILKFYTVPVPLHNIKNIFKQESTFKQSCVNFFTVKI